MSTTSRVILIENNKLYHYPNGHKVELTEYNNLSDKITIIIDDNYFFYFTIDAKPIKTKKMNMIVKNYMRTVFLSQDTVFTVFSGNDKIVVLTLSEKLVDLIRLNPTLFSKATRITTPLIETMQRDSKEFLYDSGKHSDKVANGIIRVAPIPTDKTAINKAGFLDMVAELEQYLFMGNINLPGVVRIQKASSHLASIAYGALFIYMVFVGANIINLNAEKKPLIILNEKQQEIFVEANVDGLPNPLDALISASKNPSTISKQGIGDPLAILSNLSSKETNTTVVSLAVTTSFVRVEANTDSLDSIDTYSKEIEKRVGKTVSIVNVGNFKDNNVKFSIRFEK